MMRLIFYLCILFAALPAAAEWRFTPTEAEWFVQRPTASGDIQDVRDAILWQRSRQALRSALLTAALPNVSIRTVGDARELSITMPRAQAEAWITGYVGCAADLTNAQRLACVDRDIKADLRRLTREYRQQMRDEAHPVEEPEL